jgi:dsRNA-specific ribonuclease
MSGPLPQQQQRINSHPAAAMDPVTALIAQEAGATEPSPPSPVVDEVAVKEKLSEGQAETTVLDNVIAAVAHSVWFKLIRLKQNHEQNGQADQESVPQSSLHTELKDRPQDEQQAELSSELNGKPNGKQTGEQEGELDGDLRPNNKRSRDSDGTAGDGITGSKKNKKKKTNPPELPDGMRRVQRGLAYLTTNTFPEEVRQHAQELQRLLFPAQFPPIEADPTTIASTWTAPDAFSSVSETTLTSQSAALTQDQQDPEPKVEESANPHTDLPPPFAIPAPKAVQPGPSPAITAFNRTFVPTSTFGTLPRMKNFDTTTDVPAPTSTTLPALPAITDISLSLAPFTHVSALSAYIPPTNTNSYEPLEFLGDAYLEVIATRLIHSRFPLHTVGQKAGLREILVNNETLAQYATAYGFPSRIRTSAPVKQQQGPTWTKIMADVFEAYVACIVIQEQDDVDGFLAAEQWLTALWAPKILDWKANGDGKRNAHSNGPAQDAKTDLHKLLIGKRSKVEYKETRPMELINPGNRQNFFIGAFFTGYGFDNQLLGNGEGRSKALASLEAAKDALEKSQDVIALANRRKVDDEKESKKRTAMEKQKTNARPIGAHRGFNNHNNQPRNNNSGGHRGYHQQNNHNNPNNNNPNNNNPNNNNPNNNNPSVHRGYNSQNNHIPNPFNQQRG